MIAHWIKFWEVFFSSVVDTFFLPLNHTPYFHIIIFVINLNYNIIIIIIRTIIRSHNNKIKTIRRKVNKTIQWEHYNKSNPKTKQGKLFKTAKFAPKYLK